MYRQVALNETDCDFHRILWRSDASKPIEHYRLVRLTYGIASSAFHSIRTLHAIADSEPSLLASTVLNRDFYVDDLLSGAKTVTEALALQQSLIDTLKHGGFDLRKWSSNDRSVLAHMSADMLETKDVDFDDTHTLKTLGITWNPSADSFLFSFSSPPTQPLTKRLLLSDTSQVFDPLGRLSPLVVSLKTLFQHCWTLGSDWDIPLPPEIVARWSSVRDSFSALKNLRIARFVLCTNAVRHELHIFCDASEMAYAAAAYVVSFNGSGHGHTALLCARTRVAPVKTVSLPRLEICAAHLGSKLATVIIKSLASADVVFVTGWTDSTVVLSWLNDLPRRWTTFVANRVALIQDAVTMWMHVPTTHNPADIALRGSSGHELSKHTLWWNGPEWLTTGSHTWPSQPSVRTSLDSVVKLEQRKSAITVTTACKVTPLIDFERFSSLTRLIRTTAWVFRFVADLKRGPKRNGMHLTSSEYEFAKTFLIQTVQSSAFASEIRSLAAQRELPTSSKLLPLTPFFDKTSGILRVDGRLKHSNTGYTTRHPPFLPLNHRLSYLFALRAHFDCDHGGPQLTHSRLSESVWIINARSLIRSVILHCKTCLRFSRRFKPPLMGDLPDGRVTPSRLFTHCGVDYAGPFETKSQSARASKRHKSYLALFVCFATKAVHLQLASDMTTKCFLAAFRRFVSRRGLPQKMYSDNGKKFTGAAKELSNLVQQLSRDPDLLDFSSQRGIAWHFNPPSAPHFGGLWEAGVKSIKSHLKRTIGLSVLTFEELTTVLTQVEACLNSRPLVSK